MHGWPHTFALQLDFADLLPDFHVVVVSLPGFGFSPPLDEPTTEQRLAQLVHTLMTDVLGYSRYLTYGESFSAAARVSGRPARVDHREARRVE